jgi:teichuronic acid biosynthesis glycosyltransferase TuaC
MRILFVVRAKTDNSSVTPFVRSQGDSLINLGLKVEYYLIKRKGILGYMKSVVELRRYLKEEAFDLIHAHYVLSGWVTVLARPGKPIILSLMGTDAYGDYLGTNLVSLKSRYLTFLSYLIQPFVKIIIGKSEHILSYVFLKTKAVLLPNGVDLDFFKPSTQKYREDLNLRKNAQYILFLGNKNNIRKNYKLLENSFQTIRNSNLFLVCPYPTDQSKVVKYLNSVNVLAVPSFMEGSSNVIKEAMACNCPVVSTNVGDASWLLGEDNGHYLAELNVHDFSEKLKMALNYSLSFRRTKGRKRLKKLGLAGDQVAKKLIDIYKKAIVL